MSQLIILALALVGLPAFAAESPRVLRNGSRLTIEATSPGAGSWALRTADGHPCLAGALRAGDNRIVLPKVAAPTELILSLEATDGQRSAQEVRIPGDRRLSPLGKPQGAAVLYQLPLRTYAARGDGVAQTGRMADLTAERLAEIKELGVDYLWLTGVLEHAARSQTDADVVKGDAGSYYAIYDKWDVASSVGSLADFEALIERAHAVGLRVMIDFVANHTARKHRTDVGCKAHLDFGVGDRTDRRFDPDNNYYYIEGSSFVPPTRADQGGLDGVFDSDFFLPGVQLEAPARVTGNDVVSASPSSRDWFETAKLNYGFDLAARTAHYTPRPRTWTQMADVARYWVEKGVDGLRVDFAHAVPIEFWRFFAAELRRVQPQVFLLAEAYETDERMRLPGFSYHAMLDAGFDSVYHSEMYWGLRGQVLRPGNMRSTNPMRAPAMQPNILQRGFMFTSYMENHDEVRLASSHFAPGIDDRGRRAELGLALTAYVALLPGHIMLQGGQELQEDAAVFGGYAGDDGKTSIFDFVHQSQTRTWIHGDRPEWMRSFRDKYKRLLALKRRDAFRKRHAAEGPSYIDLEGVNGYKDEAKWIASYVRFDGRDAYLVVTNGDPYESHVATVHFTREANRDTLGVLSALGIVNEGRARYRFREVFARPDWVPADPAVAGEGLPGAVLYQPGNVPSGLYLGSIPAATTYVFKIERL
jgi:glycosidase